MADLPTPPRPRKDPKRIEQLGRVRVDDYAWMKDDNWQAVLRDPSAVKAEVMEHLKAENAYTAAVLAGTEDLQAALFAEMKGRIKQDDASVPAPDGPFEYFTRFEPGAQHPRHLRRARGGGGEETLLLDEAARATEHAYYHVGAAGHSPDHALYAWAEDIQGSEFYRIRLRDLAAGEDLPDIIESTGGDFAFSPCSRWLFWIWRDENARPAKVFRRPARGGEDVLVYHEADEGMFLGVWTASDDSHILIGAQNQEISETWLIPAADPTAGPVVAEPRREAVRYSLERWDGRWIVRTNEGGAVDFKLMACDDAIPARAGWREFVPHQAGRLVAGVAAYRRHLVRLERENAIDRIVVRDLAGEEHAIDFDEAAYALSLSPGLEYDTEVTRFVYQSPTTPRQWVDYDMGSRERTLRKTQEIPSGHDPARYETRRLYARAPDGAEVPVTVLMLKGTPLDGSAPMVLYGYGAYGHPEEAAFSIRSLSLVDRGWIWALAHIRGGSDKGWGWFLDGRKFRKKNSFTDFIACAEHLIAEGYARPGRIAAYGGSAGGMLMGAIANLRPDLWGAIIAAVPFVDVLNTMSDTSLPLTPPEWPEWGNPLQDPDAYDYIASYSPYDNVAALPYPPILATGGLSDPRVTWWEPEKWVARLRDHSTSGRPLLLKINLEAGHGGASGRFEFLKEIALDYAFAVWAIEGDGVIIAAATADDIAAVAAIYGHHALHGLGTFEETAPDAAEIARRIEAITARGLPYLVARDENGVTGFAYAAPFRNRAAYRYTVEDSVYIRPGRLGRGVGKALLAAVIATCERLDLRQMVAVIGDSANAGSISLHRSLGFEQAGVFPGVGYKAGRWVDIVLMRRALNTGDGAPPEGPGLVLGGD